MLWYCNEDEKAYLTVSSFLLNCPLARVKNHSTCTKIHKKVINVTVKFNFFSILWNSISFLFNQVLMLKILFKIHLVVKTLLNLVQYTYSTSIIVIVKRQRWRYRVLFPCNMRSVILNLQNPQMRLSKARIKWPLNFDCVSRIISGSFISSFTYFIAILWTVSILRFSVTSCSLVTDEWNIAGHFCIRQPINKTIIFHIELLIWSFDLLIH